MVGPFSTLTRKQIEFLTELTKHSVDFVVIGGYAMKFHGNNRDAEDLDLLVGYEPGNAEKLLSVISRLGKANPVEARRKLTKPEVRIVWFDVELFTSIKGVEFNNVKIHATATNIDGLKVLVASVSDLLESKKAVARSEDCGDIEFLEKVVN